jgi:hypothetical protein
MATTTRSYPTPLLVGQAFEERDVEILQRLSARPADDGGRDDQCRPARFHSVEPCRLQRNLLWRNTRSHSIENGRFSGRDAAEGNGDLDRTAPWISSDGLDGPELRAACLEPLTQASPLVAPSGNWPSRTRASHLGPEEVYQGRLRVPRSVTAFICWPVMANWPCPAGLHPGATPANPGVQKGLILRGFLEAALKWRRGRDSR